MAHPALFLVVPPGLEPLAADEARTAGFAVAGTETGGVALDGGWPEAMRANLALRLPVRVLWRIGEFRAPHLAMLDRRARRFPWRDWLRPDVPVRVEASVRASRIWHAGAAADRIGRAIAETLGAPVTARGGRGGGDEGADIAAEAPGGAGGGITLKARIVDDLVTLSLDTSGAPLYRRGFRPAVAKAPLRETLAAAVLQAAGYDGAEAVVDPMCGSGTLLIEAAEIAAALPPGRGREFAFQRLAGFDPQAWAALRGPAPAPAAGPARLFGSDRDQGAVEAAAGNALRAGVGALCRFERRAVSDLAPPPGLPPGLVITNPPWGLRLGERKLLFALYGTVGRVLAERFAGWRVAVLAPDPGLVAATGLGLAAEGPPLDIGGVKARLWLGRAG